MLGTTTRESDGPPGRVVRALRTPWVLRLASSCVGSVVAGVVVGGLGARLAMRLSAVAAGAAGQGRLTDNGNVVGAITGEGTLALVVFVGLAAGLVSGLFLAALRTLLPARFLPAWVSLVLLALGSAVVIDPANPDFTIVGHRLLNVVMFSALFPAFGCFAIWVAERFDVLLLRPPLVRLAPITLVGAGLGLLIGVPGVFVLTGRIGPAGAAAIVLATLAGILVAVTSDRTAAVARVVGISALAVGTLGGLIRFVDDVVAILP